MIFLRFKEKGKPADRLYFFLNEALKHWENEFVLFFETLYTESRKLIEHVH